MDEEIESRDIEGEIIYIGEAKELANNLWSIGIKVGDDSNFHNIVEFGTAKVKNILGTAKIGDKVVLREQKIRGYWNIKEIKFIEQVQAELEGMQPLESFSKTPTTEDKIFKDSYKEVIKQAAKQAMEIVNELQAEEVFVDFNAVFAYILNKKR